METYSESVRIHFERGDMWIKKNLNKDTFYAVCLSEESFNEESALNIQFNRNLHWIYNSGAPQLAFTCSKSTVETKGQCHQILHIVVVFPFRYCIVMLETCHWWSSWVKLTLTTKRYYDISNYNYDYSSLREKCPNT